MNAGRSTFYQRKGKRMFDLAVGLVLGALSAPVQGVIAVAVAAKLGRPVLFRQVRPGINGTPFTLKKFRTMTDATAPDGSMLPDEVRLTPFGQFLRGSSADELPEIFNVIRGDMSLVGPRPLLMAYLDRYSDFEARRNEVRPGLTGLAQVRGRNDASWSEKFALDVEYVDSVSFRLDLKIMFGTILPVLLRRGISHSGHATAPEFFPELQDLLGA